MVALLIIGLVLTPALILLSNIQGQINKVSLEFHRLIAAKNMLVNMHELQRGGMEVMEKVHIQELPSTVFKYQMKKVDKMPLKELPDLYFEEVSYGPPGAGDHEHTLVTFQFNPIRTNESKK